MPGYCERQGSVASTVTLPASFWQAHPAAAQQVLKSLVRFDLDTQPRSTSRGEPGDGVNATIGESPESGHSLTAAELERIRDPHPNRLLAGSSSLFRGAMG